MHNADDVFKKLEDLSSSSNYNNDIKKVCEHCNGTGKRYMHGIEILCSCKGLEAYGNDIIKAEDKEVVETKEEIDSLVLNKLSELGLYTDYNEIASIDLYSLGESKKKFAEAKNLDIVGLDGYLKLCNTLLEKSRNGDLLKSSVFLSGSNSFGLDLLGKNIIQNYRLRGISVPDIICGLDVLKVHELDFEYWYGLLSSKVLVLKLVGNDANTLFRILFQVLEFRSMKGLATIILSNRSISNLLHSTKESARVYNARLLGMFDNSLEDPYSTVLSAEVYYTEKIKEDGDGNGGRIDV